MKNILIISHDKVGASMAGPGIRYHYMAKTLAKHFNVTLGFFGPENVPEDSFERTYNTKHIDVHDFEQGFKKADVVIALWLSDAIIAYCNQNNKLVIFDIYAPVPVENLAVKLFSGEASDTTDDFTFMSQISDYRKFLENGDAFLYSNQRQLDFWMGYAFGAGQVSPTTYTKRNLMDKFILAPMGIDLSIPVKQKKSMLRGVIPGIAKDDIILVWSGGIYNWYDGVTLVRAMAKIALTHPHIKLVFPGTKHPNENMRKWQETIDTLNEAKSLNIIDKNVFFFDSWVPYQDRFDFLLDANIGIYTHKPSIETEFSHRTRVIDSHIMVGQPVIATEGDYFADLVQQKQLGSVVPPYDVTRLAEAITRLCEPSALKKAKLNMQRIRSSFSWDETLSGLIQYIASNPKKSIRAMPLESHSTPLRAKRFTIVKRAIPTRLKKLILLIIPDSIKAKLIGK